MLIYVDGAALPVPTADPRPDVVEQFPALGPDQGYHATLGAGPGRHQVCVYGLGLIGCLEVTVPGPAAIGAVDTITTGSNLDSIDVHGWAIDSATADPTDVMIYVDDRAIVVPADLWRADLGMLFPGYGPLHAFTAELGLPGLHAPGAHRVCAYGLAGGTYNEVGCRAWVEPNHAPTGSLDQVVGGTGSVDVAGWSIDWNTGAPIEVHLSVDGAILPVVADGARPDVGAAFDLWGPDHGFTATLGAAPGTRTVCAWGIDANGGTNTLLGCRTVTVG